jgi:hypothetical protein
LPKNLDRTPRRVTEIELARRIRGAGRSRSPVLRQAVVDSIDDEIVHIKIGGDDNAVPSRYLDSYSPTIGDTVFLLQTEPDLLVLGKLAQPT